MKPRPLELLTTLTEDDVELYKRLDCARYDDCLTAAALRGFQQFTCNRCHAYEQESPKKAEDFAKAFSCWLGGSQ